MGVDEMRQRPEETPPGFGKGIRAMNGKSHWYDGYLYDTCIAPNQDVLFAAIRRALPQGCTVLDVGCGTGRLAFQIAGHCRLVHGIDLSLSNVRQANKRLVRLPSIANVEFFHTSLQDHLRVHPATYDVAVMTYVIHEVEEGERAGLLGLLSDAADTILLGDYKVPRVRGLYDLGTEIVEFLAGRDHYRGFKSFVRRGGLQGEVRAAGLAVVGSRGLLPAWAELLVVKKAGV